MSHSSKIDVKTRVAEIQQVADSLQSGWLARPSLDNPRRSTWEAKCREELKKLKALVRGVNDILPVPPLVLAFLVEHNRAYTARATDYDYESLNPENSYDKAGLFVRDKKYKFKPQQTGWWEDPGARIFSAFYSCVVMFPYHPGFDRGPSDAAPQSPVPDNKDSKKNGKTKLTSAAVKIAPVKSAATSSARDEQMTGDHDDELGGVKTRSRTRVRRGIDHPDPSEATAPSAERKPVPSQKSGRSRTAKVVSPPRETPTPSRDASLPPAPTLDDEIWDPESTTLSDAWLLSVCHM